MNRKEQIYDSKMETDYYSLEVRKKRELRRNLALTLAVSPLFGFGLIFAQCGCVSVTPSVILSFAFAAFFSGLYIVSYVGWRSKRIVVDDDAVVARGLRIPVNEIVAIRWNQNTGSRRSAGRVFSITFNQRNGEMRERTIWIRKSDLPSQEKLKAALERTGHLVE